MSCKYFLPVSACVFIILITAFEEKFLTLMKSNLSIYYFMSQDFGVKPKEIFA